MALCPDLWDSMGLLSMGLNNGYTSVHRKERGVSPPFHREIFVWINIEGSDREMKKITGTGTC